MGRTFRGASAAISHEWLHHRVFFRHIRSRQTTTPGLFYKQLPLQVTYQNESSGHCFSLLFQVMNGTDSLRPLTIFFLNAILKYSINELLNEF